MQTLILWAVLTTSPNQEIIKQAAQAYNAKVCDSKAVSYLCEAAQLQAEWQSFHCKQGHQNFNERFQVYQRDFAPLQYAEICAESWKRQENDSDLDLWKEAFKCWRQSPGHWSVAKQKHRFFGFGKSKGTNGIWYFCILVGD